MPATLEQRTPLSRQTFTLDYNGVRIRRSTWNQDMEWLLPYEEIPATRCSFHPGRQDSLVLAAVVCVACAALGRLAFGSEGGVDRLTAIALVACFGAPMVILVAASWAFYIRARRPDVIGYGVPGHGIFLQADRPSRAAVEAFLENLHTAKVTYLREMYLDYATSASTEEQLRRLVWLKNLGALAEDEFQTRRLELNARRPPDAGRLGF